MFKSGPNYEKLKTNLRLVVNRLKLLEKKRTEMALKARKEIADYISNHKDDRARIRVEHIIREDYTVEAFEILEMYADLLATRFGLIQTQKELDPGLSEAVDSILWATPRLVADVPEFRAVCDQLTIKYGKERAEAARMNRGGGVGAENPDNLPPSGLEPSHGGPTLSPPICVNEKLVHKMGVRAPPATLVERYMIEIAGSYGVAFEPDPKIMAGDELWLAEKMLDDFDNKQPSGGAAAQIPQGPFPPEAYARPPPVQPYPPQNQYPPPGAHGGMAAGPLPPKPPLDNGGVDLDLPTAPTGMLPGGHGGGQQPGGGDMDFDDLTKRFEELKQRK